MNYLAHIYLSGADPEIKIGNFIADAVKGKNYENYPEGIKKGILLHRHIDSFTDHHPIYKHSKHVLQPKYNLYSGVIMDILFDHFLAKNWERYSHIPLLEYSEEFYHQLEERREILPERIVSILPYIKEQNWLYSYRTKAGIHQILKQMDKRTKYISKMSEVDVELAQYYLIFETDFFAFFDELIKSVNDKKIALEI